MNIEKMTFAENPIDEVLDHERTDEYAAAIAAVERGEPDARTRLLKAYAKFRLKTSTRVLRRSP